jgi:hypothetical protein
MTTRTVQNDAGEAIYLARQLESILPETKDVIYRDMRSKEFIPVNGRHNAGTKTITWRSFSKYGRAKIVAAYGATDIPAVSRAATEQSIKVHTIANRATWTKQEVREAAMANYPLTTSQAMDATEANAREADTIAWVGDTAHGINGLLNYPGLTAATIPADGTGGLKTWASKTGEQILRDAANMIKAVTVTTNGVEKPNTLLLPLSVYIDIGTRVMSASNGSNITILAMLKENLGKLGVTTIEGLPELETVGVGGVGRAFIYTRDPRKVEQHMPLMLDVTAPQPDGLQWNSFYETRYAGTTIYYILSAAYGDGV